MSALATPPANVFVFSDGRSVSDPILNPLLVHLGRRVVVSGDQAPVKPGQRDIAVVIGAGEDFIPSWTHLRWSHCRKLLVTNGDATGVDQRLFDRVWHSTAADAAAEVVEHVLHHLG